LARRDRGGQASDDVGPVVAQSQVDDVEGVVRGHPPAPLRLVAISSQTRYGAPIRPVTTPVDRETGSRCCPSTSATEMSRQPARADATIPDPESATRRAASGPAMSATKAIGPAAAV